MGSKPVVPQIRRENRKYLTFTWLTDDDLPKRWKYCFEKPKNCEKWRASMLLLSPNGKYFKGMPQALKHMASSGIYRNDDIFQMEQSLYKDGWVKHNLLPSGWTSRIVGDHQWFLTPSPYGIVKGVQNLVTYLNLHKYDETFIDTIEKGFVRKNAATKPPEKRWIKDELLPTGWKLAREVEVAKGSENYSNTTYFLSPSGKTIRGRTSLLRHMLTTSSFTLEETLKVKEGFLYEGWSESDFLPKGWLMKNCEKGRFQFLSPGLDNFKSQKDVLDHMYKNIFLEEEITKFTKIDGRLNKQQNNSQSHKRKDNNFDITYKRLKTLLNKKL